MGWGGVGGMGWANSVHVGWRKDVMLRHATWFRCWSKLKWGGVGWGGWGGLIAFMSADGRMWCYVMLRCEDVEVTSGTLWMLRCEDVEVTSRTLWMLRCEDVEVTSGTLWMLRCEDVEVTSGTLGMLRCESSFWSGKKRACASAATIPMEFTWRYL